MHVLLLFLVQETLEVVVLVAAAVLAHLQFGGFKLF